MGAGVVIDAGAGAVVAVIGDGSVGTESDCGSDIFAQVGILG